MSRIKDIRYILSEFVECSYGETLREELKTIADNTYKQKYSDTEYLNFMSEHEVSFEVVGAQSKNDPYYLEMFTVLTQHIYADNVRQLLDKAIDIENCN